MNRALASHLASTSYSTKISPMRSTGQYDSSSFGARPQQLLHQQQQHQQQQQCFAQNNFLNSTSKQRKNASQSPDCQVRQGEKKLSANASKRRMQSKSNVNSSFTRIPEKTNKELSYQTNYLGGTPSQQSQRPSSVNRYSQRQKFGVKQTEGINNGTHYIKYQGFMEQDGGEILKKSSSFKVSGAGTSYKITNNLNVNAPPTSSHTSSFNQNFNISTGYNSSGTCGFADLLNQSSYLQAEQQSLLDQQIYMPADQSLGWIHASQQQHSYSSTNQNSSDRRLQYRRKATSNHESTTVGNLATATTGILTQVYNPQFLAQSRGGHPLQNMIQQPLNNSFINNEDNPIVDVRSSNSGLVNIKRGSLMDSNKVEISQNDHSRSKGNINPSSKSSKDNINHNEKHSEDYPVSPLKKIVIGDLNKPASFQKSLDSNPHRKRVHVNQSGNVSQLNQAVKEQQQPLRVLSSYQNRSAEIDLNADLIQLKPAGENKSKLFRNRVVESEVKMKKNGQNICDDDVQILASDLQFESCNKLKGVPSTTTSTTVGGATVGQVGITISSNSINFSKETAVPGPSESNSNIEEMHFYSVDFQQNCKKWLSQIEKQF